VRGLKKVRRLPPYLFSLIISLMGTFSGPK